MSRVKVIHLNTSDSIGGAARAAYRTHQAQLKSGIDSYMRVLYHGTADNRVTAGAPVQSRTAQFLEKLFQRWIAHSQKGWHTENPIIHTFGHESARLVDELNRSDADVLNLHWISGLLSVEDIGRLQKPIVWTLHDMWAFCGGEHYVSDDSAARFRVGYRTDNRPLYELGPDLNRRTWDAKCRAWARQRFTIVTPSRWLAECARQSLLFSDASVHVIPNPLDTVNIWRPIPQEAARIALGLPTDKKLILMGADGGVTDPRKGGDLLRDAVAHVVMQQSGAIELMIYGQGHPASTDIWPCPVHWLGRVYDDRLLALAYSAADVMVVPSRQDNLPNTAVEAQACGTPVVAFNIGGLQDIVEHRITGYLVRPFELSDLAEGINWVLQNEKRRLALSLASRDSAVKKFAEPVIASKYCNLYEQLLALPVGA